MMVVIVAAAVVFWGVTVGMGDGVGDGAGCGNPVRTTLSTMYTTTTATTATTIIPIFFRRRRCFFFRTISLYRAGRYGSLKSSESSFTIAAS
jgi:uncharacterized membrane protein YedE/YeeE